MPPKKLVEVPLFPPESSQPSRNKTKPQPASSSVSKTVVDCFPSTSFTISPPSPPVTVPRNPLSRKGLRVARPVCTKDIVPAKKKVTFNLSSACPSSLPSTSGVNVTPPSACSSSLPPTSGVDVTPPSACSHSSSVGPLSFGQSLSLMLSDPSPPLPGECLFCVSSPGLRFVTVLILDPSLPSFSTGLRFPLTDQYTDADMSVAHYEEVETSSADSAAQDSTLLGDLLAVPLKHPFSPSLTVDSPLYGQPRLYSDEDYVLPPCHMRPYLLLPSRNAQEL